MLLKIACIIIIFLWIDAIVYGVLYYREITKEDREYAKELKEAKKRRKLEAEEKAQKLKESGFSLDKGKEKNEKSDKKKTKPGLRFRLLIAFPCLIIFWFIYMLIASR